MFMIKRIEDKRMAQRIQDSFGVDSPGAVVYGAFKDDNVLATAVFVKEGDCLTLTQVDTGRRMDSDLVDGMARAAFHAGRRTGIKRGKLGEQLPRELKLALSKQNYEMDEPFGLAEFFAKKKCGK